MKLEVSKARERIERWLWQPREPQQGHLLLWRICRVAYAVGRDLFAGTMTLYAMSLVYTTLLSVVPSLALSFSVLKALGVHNQMEPALFTFFQPLGPQGLEIAQNIITFVDNVEVGVLGSLGLGFLIYTVISLVQKVEHSFNEIWHVTELRSLAQRFSNYLSVIVIGPVLVVSALGVTATLVASDQVQQLRNIELFGTLYVFFSKLVPYFLITLAFIFVYSFVPNTRVKLSSAIIGGAVAGIAWQTTGLLFASFVVDSTNYEAIYSGFAVGILALIWLYLNWLILLLGAAITYYVQHPELITERLSVHSSPEVEEKAGLQILLWVAQAFDRGQRLSVQALSTRLELPADIVSRQIGKLRLHGLLTQAGADGGDLVPGKSLDQIRIVDALRAIRRDDDRLFKPKGGFAPELQTLWTELEASREEHLGHKSLLDLVRSKDTEARHSLLEARHIA